VPVQQETLLLPAPCSFSFSFFSSFISLLASTPLPSTSRASLLRLLFFQLLIFLRFGDERDAPFPSLYVLRSGAGRNKKKKKQKKKVWTRTQILFRGRGRSSCLLLAKTAIMTRIKRIPEVNFVRCSCDGTHCGREVLLKSRNEGYFEIDLYLFPITWKDPQGKE